jgi:hypothetical protein
MVAFFTALEAILWCLSVQLELFKEPWSPQLLQLPGARQQLDNTSALVFCGIRVRMGIHSGTPNCRKNPVTGRMDYFGGVVNQAARVSDAAHGGQIAITQEVYEVLQRPEAKQHALLQELDPVVRDLGKHALKGIQGRVQIYELLPRDLAGRSSLFPPLRTGEEKEKEKERRPTLNPAQIAAAAAALPSVAAELIAPTPPSAAAAAAVPSASASVTSGLGSLPSLPGSLAPTPPAGPAPAPAPVGGASLPAAAPAASAAAPVAAAGAAASASAGRTSVIKSLPSAAGAGVESGVPVVAHESDLETKDDGRGGDASSAGEPHAAATDEEEEEEGDDDMASDAGFEPADEQALLEAVEDVAHEESGDAVAAAVAASAASPSSAAQP